MVDVMSSFDQLYRIAKHIHYPECWDTMAYPTLADAVQEITCCDPEQCSHQTTRQKDTI